MHVSVHMTEQWGRSWSPVVSAGEEATQRQIINLTEGEVSAFWPATHESNAFLITLVSNQTYRVHLITAKLTICEQFVAGLGRKTLVVIRMKQNGHTGQTKGSFTQCCVFICSCRRWLWMSKNRVNMFLCLLLSKPLITFQNDSHFFVHFLIPNDFFSEQFPSIWHT